MGQALATVLPLAVAIAVFPIPIIASVLMVGSDRGITKGLVFVAAWGAGLGALCAVSLVFSDSADASESGDPATWVSVLLLVLGVGAIAAAVKQWRDRPRSGGNPSTPRWMQTIDDFTLARATGAGIALTVLNPKNVLLAVAAAAEIAAFGLDVDQQVVAALLFVLIASAGVLTPVVLAVTLGARSREVLERLKSWMARNNAVIMAVLLLLIGVKLIGDAIVGFTD